MRFARLAGLLLVGCGGIARVDGSDPMSPKELVDPLFEAFAEDPAESLPITGPVNLDVDIFRGDVLVRLALKMKGPNGLIAVSDAMPLAGMGVSSGVFCGQEVCSDGKRATLSDGTLAGSVTLLPEALSRTAQALGWDQVSLQNMGSLNAAEDLGLPRRGSLRSDYRADLVIHGESGIEAVMRGGLSVEDAEGPRLPATIEQVR